MKLNIITHEIIENASKITEENFLNIFNYNDNILFFINKLIDLFYISDTDIINKYIYDDLIKEVEKHVNNDSFDISLLKFLPYYFNENKRL